jgi:hypothetical protein
MSVTCPPFWFDSPRILVSEASQFFPFAEAEQRCTAAALNSFTRFGLYLGLALAIIRMEPLWLILGVTFAIFAGGAWFYMSAHGSVREGFTEGGMDGVPQTGTADIVDTSFVDELYVPDVIGSPSARTEPTAANPFMNVLISEISMNPLRPAAGNVQGVKIRSDLDSYFDTMFTADPGDTFNRTQSQRQWVTMPSTTIPNDQESYQNWLYRVEGRTCKEGNLGACNFSTDNKMPWREMKPTT